MAIAVLSVLYGLVPTSMVIALMATAYPVTPWPGWKVVHSTIDDVVYVPARDWQTNSARIACVELRRWIIASLAFAVFFCLGFTSDMKKKCRASFRGTIGQAGCGAIHFNPISPHLRTCSAVPEQNTNEDSNNHRKGTEIFVRTLTTTQFAFRTLARSSCFL